MNTPPPRILARTASRLQRNWDWRAATNFIAGGSGAGALLWSAPLAVGGAQVGAGIALGLALIACGLTCVWLEIGKPWRALNAYRHLAASWMTREAAIAPLLMACGLLALWRRQPVYVGACALLGLAFVYAQARILAADRGIPAWRHPRSRALVVVSGLTEGAALLLCLGLVDPAARATPAWAAPLLLAALLALRLRAWRGYLDALARDAAPAAALVALRRLDKPFVRAGHLAPIALALLGAALRQPLLAGAGAAAAAAAGWAFKYTLVCRAAYTQGFALPALPVRGGGLPRRAR